MSKSDTARLLESLSSSCGQSDPSPRVLLIRARAPQKALVARGLERFEQLRDLASLRPPQTATLLAAAAGLESDAGQLGLAQLAAAARAMTLLGTCLHQPVHLSPLQLNAIDRMVCILSTLLLRVYITGSDADGDVEREEAQRLVCSFWPQAASQLRTVSTRSTTH